MLWMYQRVIMGPARSDGLYGGHRLVDLSRREIAVLIPIVILVVWIGVFPKTFLNKSAPMVKHTVEQLESVKRGSPIQFGGSLQQKMEGK